ncbi:MAG: DUF4491 family protein [Anaerolineales bacterium]|nr:DUF4491 family protein [Anaerolineales bacterium]
MIFNYLGLAAGLAAFLGIWIGHVAVREIECRVVSITLPSIGFALLGFLCEIGAFLSASNLVSGTLGILGMTFLWDALEFHRQQKRIVKGRAPANPANPRHARILAEYPTATTLDLLKREPLGRPVGAQEAIALIKAKEKLL